MVNIKPRYEVAICGTGATGNTVGNYAGVYTSDYISAIKAFDMYVDSLLYRGWIHEVDWKNNGEVEADRVEKFSMDGHIRYVCRWET